jgi:hypothetical protein
VTTCLGLYSCRCTGPRSQRPHGLRGRYAAARLLGLRVRIHRDYRCLSLVFFMCFPVEFSATIRTFVQRSPTDFGVSECDLETSTRRRPSSIRTFESWKQKYRHKRMIELSITFYRTFLYRFLSNLRKKTFLNVFFSLALSTFRLFHCVELNFYFYIFFILNMDKFVSIYII